MASGTMQTCHLPRETRLAPRKPVAYSQRKMPANRVSNPRRDCWPQLPRKLHHPPGGAPKAPRVRGSRSLLAAAAGQENSIPQRFVETKPRNFFSFLYTLRHGLLTMPAFPAPCDAIDLAGDDFVRCWSQTCASPYNASDSIGGRRQHSVVSRIFVPRQCRVAYPPTKKKREEGEPQQGLRFAESPTYSVGGLLIPCHFYT
jgi:hypothetical protein